MRNYAIFGYCVGYLLAAFTACAAAYLVCMPFGIGYVAAEITGAYLAWCTAYRWELLNEHLQAHLEAHGY